MGGSKIPGPLSSGKLAGPVEDGTLAREPSPVPGPSGAGASSGSTAPAGTGPAPSPGSGATAAATDPEIETLDLAPAARKAAYALKQKHPSVKFTSGRRSKADQARAMASNVVLNRKWIEQTYVKGKASQGCQKWVDDNPKKTTAADIGAGLLSVMNGLADADLAAFSKHLSGQAFDVLPVEKDADAIKKAIQGLPGLGKFLDKEGGLVRWHAQF